MKLQSKVTPHVNTTTIAILVRNDFTIIVKVVFDHNFSLNELHPLANHDVIKQVEFSTIFHLGQRVVILIML
jgi:hypothetical protein